MALSNDFVPCYIVLTQISAPHCKTTCLTCCTHLVGVSFILKPEGNCLVWVRGWSRAAFWADFPDLPVAANSTACLVFKGPA